MSSYWYILIGLGIIWYAYVMWVLYFSKKTKKDSKIFANLRLNNIFAYKSTDKQTDLKAVLDQITEVEDTSKLLEAFKEGLSDDSSNSITRKKHEKLKVIRDDFSSEEKPNPEP